MIKKFVEFTLKKSKSKYHAGIFEGIISLIVNLFLFLIKFLIGLKIKSIALINDAFHSLSDSLSSLVLIIGFYYSVKPPDEEHPYGHARMEYVTGLIIVVLLGIISFELAKDSIIRIFHPQKVIFSIPLILVIVATIILKELLSEYSFELGKKTDSIAIETDAHHHKTDVYATIIVVISIIISKFGFNRIDGIIGLAISLYIGFIAYKLGLKTVNFLIGEKPHEDLINEIKKIAFSVGGVEGVHDIIVHNYGDKFIISLHIEIPDRYTPVEMHDIADEVEKRIGAKFNATCVVHQDPVNTNHPYYHKIKEFLDNLIPNKYHDLKLIGGAEKFNVIFDMNVKVSDPAKKFEIVNELKNKIKNEFKEVQDVIIKLEPEYAY